MEWTRTIAPDGEPIHLSAAKLNLRETDTAQDSKIVRAIASARADAEDGTSRIMLHSRFEATMDCFPRAQWWSPASIRLPHVPVARVVSIAYLDAAGATQTIDPARYVAKLAADPSKINGTPTRITPAYGYCWPSTFAQAGAVTVTYDVGHASVFTADATANTLTVTGPVAWAVDAAVRLSNSGGALPAPLVAARNYYIKSAAAGVYTLSATLGGSTIDLSDVGSGYNYLGEIPEGMVEWMMLRIGSLYANREEIAQQIRGNIQTMPFFDGLLDRYGIYGL